MNQLFTIRGKTIGGGIWEREIEGVSIKVRGFEFLHLFISQHDGTYYLSKNVDGTSIFDIPESKDKYIVGEEQTGFWLGKICDNPEEAYYFVSEQLKTLGEEYCRKVLERTQNIIKSLAPRN